MEAYTELFCWGNDQFGQLGLGVSKTDKTHAHPRFCSYGILIRKVSCGEEHAGFISEFGHIYTMGSNSEGKLGLNDKSILQTSSPSLVESLLTFRISDLSCGRSHTLVSSESGQVFAWGLAEHGALGCGQSENQWKPVHVIFENPVFQVSAGGRHSGFLCEDASGNTGGFVCGTFEDTIEYLPVAINSKENLKQIACGISRTLILNSQGQVLVLTKNQREESLLLVKELEEVFIERVACSSFNLALSDRGELFLWGFADVHQPQKVKSSCPIIDVSAGGNFALALGVDHSVLAWGNNSSGELGQGNYRSSNGILPVLALKGKRITRLACGGKFSICLGDNVGSPGLKRRHLSEGEIARKNQTRMNRKSMDISKTKAFGFENERDYKQLVSDLGNLQDKLDVRNSQFEELHKELKIVMNKRKCEQQTFKRKEKEFMTEIDRLGAIVRQSELNDRSLEYENIKLKEEIQRISDHYNQEVHKLQEIISNLEKSHAKMRREHVKNKEEKQKMNMQHSREVQELKDQFKSMKEKQIELKLECEHRSKEIEKLNLLLEDSIREKNDIEKENFKLSETNRKLIRMSEDVKYSTQVELSQRIKEFEEYTSSLEGKYMEQVNSSEMKCLVLEKDINRIRNEYEEELRKLEDNLKEQMNKNNNHYETVIKNLTHENRTLLENSKVSYVNEERNNKLQNDYLKESENYERNIKYIEEEKSKLESENYRLEQDNRELKSTLEELSLTVEKLRKENSDKFSNFQDFQSAGENDFLKIENRRLKEDINELEAKNKQLFDSLQRELALRAQEYRDRTISLINTPIRPTSTQRSYTPVNQSYNGDTASELLQVLHQHSPRYLTTPSRESITRKFY